MQMTKKLRLTIFGLGILSLFAFYLFSREVKRGFLKQQDFNMTVRLQDHIPARFDSLWETISLPVEPVPSVVIVFLVTAILGFQATSWKKRFAVFAVPLLFGLLVFGEMYGKSVVHHPSPPFFMIKNPTTIFPQFYINEQYSYPSGHTARAVFLAFAIFPLFRKKKLWLSVFLGAYIVLVAIGRIYLGHHWLSDVIGGVLLGAGLGFLSLTGVYLRI